MQWSEVVSRLLAGEDLSREQSYWLMDRVMSGELGEVRLSSALTALAVKGAAISEVHGFADAMRDHAVSTELPSDSLDIVGTGGDGHSTVNVSTMSAIVLAAAGVPIVKHGNRAATSASGSADVLEALGVNLELSPERIRMVFDEVGIAFLFANKMHPSMRHAAPVRRALGFPTAFNVLGPLTNPARPRACAIGSANFHNAELMAGVCAGRGLSALLFRGRDMGLDELTTCDVNQIWEVSGGAISFQELDARAAFGLAPCALSDLRGGSAVDNAAVAREVFAGRGAVAVRDAVSLNVAAGLVAYGALSAVQEGCLTDRLGAALAIAQEILASGAALDLLDRWVAASNR